MIFCDMDGVLCDFEKMVKDNSDIKDFPVKDEVLWPAVKAIDPFWEKIPWTTDGKELWEFLLWYDVTILTAPSKHDTERAKKGKTEWIRRELGGDVPIIFSKGSEKINHLSPGDILIDDWPSNFKRFGEIEEITGILHTSARSSIKELKAIRNA